MKYHTIDTLIIKLNELREQVGKDYPVYIGTDMGVIELPVDEPTIEEEENGLPKRIEF